MFKRTLAIALLGSQFIAPLSLAEEDRSAVLDNIKPVGSVRVVGQSAPVVVEAAPAEAAPAEAAPVAEAAPAVDAEAAPAAVDGNAVYMKACFACHGTGAAGAPKLGDKAAWAPRIATGMDALLHSALNGKGAMPPKGGQMQLTEAEIRAGIEHMVSAAQ
jgi:cytochrome c5